MPARILFAAKSAGTDGFGDAWWDGRCGEAGDCPQQSAMGSLVMEGGLEEGMEVRKWRFGAREWSLGITLFCERAFGGVLRRKGES